MEEIAGVMQESCNCVRRSTKILIIQRFKHLVLTELVIAPGSGTASEILKTLDHEPIFKNHTSHNHAIEDLYWPQIHLRHVRRDSELDHFCSRPTKAEIEL